MNYYNRTRNRGTCSSQNMQQETAVTNKSSCRPVCRSAFMRAEEIDRERAASGWNPYAGEEENPQEEQMAGMDGRMTREWTERRQMNDWQTNNWRMDDRRRDERQRENRWEDDWREGERRRENRREDDWREGERRRENRREDDWQEGERRRESWQGDDGQMDEYRMEQSCPGQCRPYFQMPDYTQILEDMKTTEKDFRKLQTMYPETAKMLLPYVEEACDRMEYEGSPMFDEYPDQTTVLRIQDRILEQVKDRIPAEEEGEQEQTDMVTMQYQGRRRVPPGRRRVEDLIRVLLLQEMHHRRCRHRGCRRGY